MWRYATCFKQFVTGERFDSFSFLCHCTRYAVAVTGGVCDFRRDLRAGLSVVENLAGELAGAEYTGRGDLDSLELTNDEKPLENSPLMWISRGIMPYFPFI